MRRRLFAAGVGLLLLAVSALVWLMLKSANGSFIVEGRVAGFGGETTVYVEHDTVSGYLPAQTIPLRGRRG